MQNNIKKNSETSPLLQLFVEIKGDMGKIAHFIVQ